jgi:hypothetical protein
MGQCRFTEDVEVGALFLAGQGMAGLGDEVRHVDHGQRIRTFKHEHAADRNAAQRFLGAQHGLRTAQATQVEDRLVALVRPGHRWR